MPDSEFKFHVAMTAFEKAGDDHPMRIGGMVSSDALDKQGEKVLQNGLDFGGFLSSGYFNDNHKSGTADILGYPDSAKFYRKGSKLPTGAVTVKGGWFTSGYLLNTKKGREVWELAQALSGRPRQLGFSIEGRVVERDAKAPNVIKRAEVRNVAITPCPVNPDTELVTLTKALLAGSVVEAPPASPGEGFPLRLEDMGGTFDTDWANMSLGDALKWWSAQVGSKANGGQASTVTTKSETATEVDEVAEAQRFAAAVQAEVQSILEEEIESESRLTRSEALSIIRGRFPLLSQEKVSLLIAFSTSPLPE